jgi:hypothetical protein
MINSWEDVTLDKWVKIISTKEKTNSEEAIDLISILSDIPAKVIKELSINDVSVIMNKIAELQKEENTELKTIIKVNDIEYGFHPNLEEITLGEYADLETYLKDGIENNITITEKEGDNYSIEAYGKSDLRIRAEKLKMMKAKDVNNSLVFFWTFVKELLKTLQQFLMQQNQKILNKVQMNNLPTGGVGSV